MGRPRAGQRLLHDVDDGSDPPSGRIEPPRQSDENSMIDRQSVKPASGVGSCLFIEQDHCGRWVVRDAQGLCGGLFANRAEAIRFAMYECQRRPQSVIMLPGGLELTGAAPALPPALAPARAA